jgi:hypothetical protein
VDVAGVGRVHAAEIGARPCCGPASAVGAPLRCGSADAVASPPGGFVAFGGAGHAGEGAETLREVACGRPKGRLSGRAKRYPALKKAA